MDDVNEQDSSPDDLLGSSDLASFEQNNGQFQLRAQNEDGTVTYRLVQVMHDEDGNPHFIDSPMSAAQGTNADDVSSTPGHPSGVRYAYVPAHGVDTLKVSSLDDVMPVGDHAAGTAGSGQFYVMVAQDVSHPGQRNIVPRLAGNLITDFRQQGPRLVRDARRKETHKEVERRRRDKINTWIVHLSKLLPNGMEEMAKSGDSKCAVLAKAYDYIIELRDLNNQLADGLKSGDGVSVDAQLLRQECEELRAENEALRAQCCENGLLLPDFSVDASDDTV